MDTGRTIVEREEGAQAPLEARAGPRLESGWSARRINRLLDALDASTYLEVGVNRGTTFLAAAARHRIGVDPAFMLDVDAARDDRTELVSATSDDFFASLPVDRAFDVVYLDGLHTFEQTYRDLCSSLLHTHARSVILLDDTLPSDPYSAVPDQRRSLRLRQQARLEGRNWHGDVYKVVAAVHAYHPGLDYRTIVGSGNPQTLVWRSRGGTQREARLSITEIDRLSYFDLLDRRELLREASEDEAISACLAALQGPPAAKSG
jgi:hypothetical protein